MVIQKKFLARVEGLFAQCPYLGVVALPIGDSGGNLY